MSQFVRKNELIISGKFYVRDNPTAQPSSATAVLSYDNMSGARAQDTIALTMDATTKIWSGVWDSSVTKGGRVEWVVYSSGGVIAAVEGFFIVAANRANVI